MKKSNEQKSSTKNRLINFLVKPIPEDKKVRSKSPVHKFQYQLPRSFFAAVNEARADAGYDVLPRFHHLTLSSSNHRQKSSSSRSTEKQHHHRSNQHKNSTNLVDHVATKKPQKNSHHHRQKQLVQSSSDSPVVRKAVAAPKAIRRASK